MRFLLPLMLALASPSLLAERPPRKPIGWTIDPATWPVRVPSEPPTHLLAFGKDESPRKWKRRFSVVDAVRPEGETLTARLQASSLVFAEEFRCGKDFAAIPITEFDTPESAAAMWLCRRIGKSREGIIAFARLLDRGSLQTLAVAAQKSRRFKPGQIPIDKEQATAMLSEVASVQACNDLTIWGCMPDPEHLVAANRMPPDPATHAAIADAERLGQAMFAQDQVAWHGTDAYAASPAFDAKGGGGFIAQSGDDGSGSVYFVSLDGDRIRRVVPVRRDRTGQFTIEAPRDALPEDMAPRFAALRAVMRAGEHKTCSERINTIVLPASSPGRWFVYLMTSTTDPAVFPIGGHQRFEVDGLGQIVDVRQSARSCVAIPTNAPVPDADHEAITLSHLVSDLPTEFHVFASLHIQEPIYVATRDAVWRVHQGWIERLDL